MQKTLFSRLNFKVLELEFSSDFLSWVIYSGLQKPIKNSEVKQQALPVFNTSKLLVDSTCSDIIDRFS